jgi:hypothetical protein
VRDGPTAVDRLVHQSDDELTGKKQPGPARPFLACQSGFRSA